MVTGREALAQRRDRCDEHHAVLDETPSVIDGASARVRGDDVEIEVLDAIPGERLDDGVDERGCDTALARIRHDVEVGEPPQAHTRPSCEREAQRAAVFLRKEGEPRRDDLADLGELDARVVLGVR